MLGIRHYLGSGGLAPPPAVLYCYAITGTTASRQASVAERRSRSRLKAGNVDMLTYIKAHSAEFNPAEVLVLVGAFNKAWQSILDSGARLDEKSAESTREILSKRIIETAKKGELNQKRLCEDALAHLTAMNLRSSKR
jgi:hypothetical protein